MTTTEARPGSRSALTFGLVALFGGLWLFLDAQGVGVPRFKELWPTLLLLAAVSALVDYLFLSRRPSAAGFSLAWLGFGILGFFGVHHFSSWSQVLNWLPSVPTIIGLALLVTWFASGRQGDNLPVAGGILVGLGLMGFGARFDILRRILPSAQVLWAVLLLAGGGFLIYRALAGNKAR